MKGIILAGGTGSRLYPMNRVLGKQLLPVFDKPLVYYPLTTLMLGGARDVLVISTPAHLPHFHALLGDGSQWGMSFAFAEQAKPTGIPDAFVIGRDFIGDAASVLALGDNIFHGEGLRTLLERASASGDGATVLVYGVTDPQRYGVIELSARSEVISIEEKPASPRSRYAITGLYFVDRSAPEIAAGLEPSTRGETEITDLLKAYWRRGRLRVEQLGRGMMWLDTGTPESMHEAASFVEAVQRRQGQKIACPEELAYRLGFIDADQLARLARDIGSCAYGDYLRQVLMT